MSPSQNGQNLHDEFGQRQEVIEITRLCESANKYMMTRREGRAYIYSGGIIEDNGYGRRPLWWQSACHDVDFRGLSPKIAEDTTDDSGAEVSGLGSRRAMVRVPKRGPWGPMGRVEAAPGRFQGLCPLPSVATISNLRGLPAGPKAGKSPGPVCRLGALRFHSPWPGILAARSSLTRGAKCRLNAHLFCWPICRLAVRKAAKALQSMISGSF